MIKYAQKNLATLVNQHTLTKLQKMKKTILTLVAFLALGLSSQKLFAQAAPAAPAAAAPAATGTVLDTLSRNPDYEVMALLVRSAGLTATLKGAGPYTIFAPTTGAFSSLTPAQQDELMKDPAKLATIIKGHVVEGKYDKAAILKALKPTATLKTIDGQTLTLGVEEKRLVVTDAQGNKAKVVAFDMVGSNGVAIGLGAVLTK